MSSLITEEKSVQYPFIEYAEQMGWKHVPTSEALAFREGLQGKFFYHILERNLIKLNQFLSPENAQEIIRQIENIPDDIEGNKQVLDRVRGNGTFYDTQEQRNRYVKLIDFEEPENNDFFVTEEWTQAGVAKKNRSDIMFLINGFPLAIVENKNPKKQKSMDEAIVQFKRYQEETPEMLCCPQVFNITDVVEYFYGATWNYSRKNIFNWKKELGHKREKSISLEEAVNSFFDKNHFLRFIKTCILFFYKEDKNGLQKTILQQHQARAVEKINRRCTEKNKNRGLIWHTQGSGKTFTMITAARMILEKYTNATVMMIIDRNELEGQLATWIDSLIGKGQQSDQQTIPIRQIENKKKLQEVLLSDDRGLIISMIHKFDGIEKDSCTREDFYVLIDEAHRSVNKDLGNHLMAALPNATMFGFTGTPVDKTSSGKGTFKIFGKYDSEGYLDKYPISESIGDGTTLKLSYTSVANQLRLPDDLLETEFLQKAESEGVSDIDDLNKVLRQSVKLKNFLKADDRIEKVAEYIADHFKKNVKPLRYKAFIVAVDREACALYKEALDKFLSPEMSQTVYSRNYNDTEILVKHTIRKDNEEAIRTSFRKADCDPHILIVTDKLLTGYDAPILYCMYLDKPMRDHVLLQAIARVNRPYEDSRGISKSCGLIVDFVGIFKSMQKALSFDPDEVNAVIEDLDRLFDRFKELIDKNLRRLPFIISEKSDKLIEKLLYEYFVNTKKREEFIRYAKELEAAYEVLSPSARLEPYQSHYRNIIEIHQLLKRAYSGKSGENETEFLDKLSHKTERLVKDMPQVYNFKTDRTFEINVETLKQIKENKETSNIKVMDLIKSILKVTREEQNKNPILISIAERANDILEDFKNQQKRSEECLKELCRLSEEIINIKQEQETSELEDEVFPIYWSLKKYIPERPQNLAIEISNSCKKFKHFNDNPEELRQLKTEIYRILMSKMNQDSMPKLVDEILTLMEKIYEN